MHGLDTYDYGARQYDPARITWDRMDQYAEKYYHLNPYLYCAGNPVRFNDPDGREWGMKKEGDQWVVFANVSFINEAHLTSEEISEYQNSIKSEFSELISTVSNGQVIGKINFDTPQSEKQLNLSLTVTVDGSFVCAYGSTVVATKMNNGEKLSKMDFAYSSIHEHLHTLTLPDVVDNTSKGMADTELVVAGNGFVYNSGQNSAPNLSQNVMSNYVNVIDGKKLDVTQKQLLTNAQFDYIKRNINLQMQGAGSNHDPNKLNYFLNFGGNW